jgi:hypothetical protein
MRANFTILLGIPTEGTKEHCLLLAFASNFNGVRITGIHSIKENLSRGRCVEFKTLCLRLESNPISQACGGCDPKSLRVIHGLLPLRCRVRSLVHSWSTSCSSGFPNATLVAIRAA